MATSRRLAGALTASIALHAVAVVTILSPSEAHRAPDMVLVELIGAGHPFPSPRDVAGAGADASGRGDPPALGASAPSSPEPEAGPAPAVEALPDALVAEREESAVRAEAEAAAIAESRVGDEIAALTAQNVELAAELTAERERAERLEQVLAEQRAAADASGRDAQHTYDELVAALRQEIAARDVALRHAREGLAVSIVDRVLFGSGEATLSADGRAVVDKVARVLAATPTGRVVIEGHTDDVPIGAELRARFPSNWELSAARASEVVRRLVERGLPPLRLEATGRADTQPLASNATEAGRRRNRRIEIIVSGTDAPPSG
jgi:chemotaxis protein MotB